MKTTLTLQRLDDGKWCNIRVMDVTPFTVEGFEACKKDLENQGYLWDRNYPTFFNSHWRVV
jgi:hypothetical protein